MTSLASGRVVGGRFELARLIGSGGMGEVWLAFDQELEEHVAAKFLLDDRAPERLALLRRECRNARRLAHPAIVPVYDFHRTAEHAFVTMAFVDASSIASLRGRPWSEVAPALLQLSDALAFAHAKGVIHRDLKVENVLFDGSSIHILDFGIAAALGPPAIAGESEVRGGGSVGTASPEQLAGAVPAAAEDIYGFGSLARDLTSGLTLPSEVDALFTACLNHDPRHRPSSMAEIHASLRESHGSSSERPAGELRLTPPPKLTPPAVVTPRAIGKPVSETSEPFSAGRIDSRGGIGGKTIAAFVLLIALAAAVFVALPRWVERSTAAPDSSVTIPEPDESADAVAERAGGTTTDASVERAGGTTVDASVEPNAVERLKALASLKARSDALSERARQARESLEARGVGSWGDTSFRSALSAIAAAEEQHGRREFEQAAASYETALQSFEALETTANQVVRDALDRGRRALASGSATEARDAFELALVIRPGLQEARAGVARSEVLDELRGLVARARAREQDGDLEGAAEAYQRAIALDPLSEPARTGLARVDARASTTAFQSAMTEAVSALNDKDFDRAKEGFERAQAIRPNAPDAVAGLAAVEEGRKLDAIANHRAAAEQLEAREAWREAETHYQAVLAIDPTIRFAQDGKARSGERAEIAETLDFHIDNPHRLSDAAVLEQARQLVGRARSVSSGSRTQLEQQITRLDALVSEFSTPVQVYLLSDNATEVVVYKVGNIGTFDRHELVLRPGTYTVVGRRPGYRDVRHRLVVQANVPPEPLWVRCEEQI